MEIKIKTSEEDQAIDLTEIVNKHLRKSDLKNGLCSIFVRHTTCAITTADLDPGTDFDLLSFLREVSPDIDYNHPHDPDHAPDHILSSIIGPSILVPFKESILQLGTWQRIILIELNGPKERTIDISIISAS